MHIELKLLKQGEAPLDNVFARVCIHLHLWMIHHTLHFADLLNLYRFVLSRVLVAVGLVTLLIVLYFIANICI